MPKQYFRYFPEMKHKLPSQVVTDLLTDSRYICRFDVDTGAVEFGYPTDYFRLQM